MASRSIPIATSGPQDDGWRGALAAFGRRLPSILAAVALIAATIQHDYSEVMMALITGGSLYAPRGEHRPSAIVRLAPHTARSLREAHGDLANRTATR